MGIKTKLCLAALILAFPTTSRAEEDSGSKVKIYPSYSYSRGLNISTIRGLNRDLGENIRDWNMRAWKDLESPEGLHAIGIGTEIKVREGVFIRIYYELGKANTSQKIETVYTDLTYGKCSYVLNYKNENTLHLFLIGPKIVKKKGKASIGGEIGGIFAHLRGNHSISIAQGTLSNPQGAMQTRNANYSGTGFGGAIAVSLAYDLSNRLFIELGGGYRDISISTKGTEETVTSITSFSREYNPKASISGPSGFARVGIKIGQ